MADTVRLAQLAREAESLPDAERQDFLRLVRKEDPALADRLEVRLGLAPDATPSGNGRSDQPSDVTRELLTRLAEREEPRGRYRLESELSRGGQGVILCVRDEDLQRELAMKVTRAKGDARTSYGGELERRSLSRFLEEAQVTGQLDHPGIVPVHELGLDADGRAYFTMKLVKGRDLRAIFELAQRGEEGWNVTRALGVLLKVCEAMGYAHAKSVLHRDLKPANVMVGRYGEVYVMDWGIARVQGTEDRKDIRIREQQSTVIESHRHAAGDPESTLVTMDGDVLGTPAYMSPEQARGDIDAMGPRSDVYSVGAMLYHLLAGEAPFCEPVTSTSHLAIWARVRQGPPRPLRDTGGGASAPPELEAICERAMERDPARRFASMEALADDLRAFLERRVVQAYETGAAAELKKWVLRNRKLAATAAAAVLTLAVGLVTSLFLKDRADDERANVLRLAAFQDLVDLRERADMLWPPWPENVAAYEDWLAGAADLVAGLDEHRAQLDRLATRALPDAGEPVARPEREALRREADALAYALAVRRRERGIERVALAARAPPR